MQQSDYIERLIQQVAQAIAAALGLARDGDAERALQDLDALWFSTTRIRRQDLARLDPTSARAILGAKVAVAIRLLEAEIVVHEMKGDAAAREASQRLLAALVSR